MLLHNKDRRILKIDEGGLISEQIFGGLHRGGRHCVAGKKHVCCIEPEFGYTIEGGAGKSTLVSQAVQFWVKKSVRLNISANAEEPSPITHELCVSGTPIFLEVFPRHAGYAPETKYNFYHHELPD
jgi:hypothetical protein